MNEKERRQKLYLKHDKLFNALLLELYNIDNFLLYNDAKDEQEEHLFDMIEKESHELKESIEILKDKRTQAYYDYMNGNK